MSASSPTRPADPSTTFSIELLNDANKFNSSVKQKSNCFVFFAIQIFNLVETVEGFTISTGKCEDLRPLRFACLFRIIFFALLPGSLVLFAFCVAAPGFSSFLRDWGLPLLLVGPFRSRFLVPSFVRFWFFCFVPLRFFYSSVLFWSFFVFLVSVGARFYPVLGLGFLVLMFVCGFFCCFFFW